MTQATMAGLGLLTFYQYLIHVVVHEKAILNMLGMFMFVVATVTWATPVMEIVSVKTRLRNHFIPPANKFWLGGGGANRNHLVCLSAVHPSIHPSVCAIISGPYLSYGGILEVPTTHKDCL